MDLRALRFFLTLSEELHFGRAAQRHFISSQAFGREIRSLESELGVELFVRTSRRVQLTPAGERSLNYARSVLAAVDSLTAGASAGSRSSVNGLRPPQARDALITAAQRIFAEQGRTENSVHRLAEAAQVGPETFATYFSSPAELFHTAVLQMLDTFAVDLDRRLSGEDDPAAEYASSVRLTIRLVHSDPVLARVIMNSPPTVAQSSQGLAGRALKGIRIAQETGRFRVENEKASWSWATGCTISTIRVCLLEPSTPVDELADLTAASLLRMHGLPENEVKSLVALPLP